MLDEPSIKGPIPTSVRLLHSIAKQLRQRRIQAGALTLASPEVRFQLDSETADPMVCMYVCMYVLCRPVGRWTATRSTDYYTVSIFSQCRANRSERSHSDSNSNRPVGLFF